MTFLQIINGFRKSRLILDARTDAYQQMLADRKKRALRHETLKHTAGKVSVFHVDSGWALV